MPDGPFGRPAKWDGQVLTIELAVSADQPATSSRRPGIVDKDRYATFRAVLDELGSDRAPGHSDLSPD